MLVEKGKEGPIMSQAINPIGDLSLSKDRFFSDLKSTVLAQFQECPPYRALCHRQGFDPDRDLRGVGDEVKIPWIVSTSFKRSHQIFPRLLRRSPQAIQTWTVSSGTSGDPSLVGRTQTEVDAYRRAYRSAFAHAAGKDRGI